MGKVTVDFKFKIGDIVRHVLVPTNNKMIIAERIYVESDRGLSVLYKCRVTVPSSSIPGAPALVIVDNYYSFFEIELVKEEAPPVSILFNKDTKLS